LTESGFALFLFVLSHFLIVLSHFLTANRLPPRIKSEGMLRLKMPRLAQSPFP